LSTLTKPSANRDIIKFEVAQVVDILFQDWLLIDLTFILPISNEEEEGVAIPIPEV
jgi:hypothetical protein